MSKLNIFLDKLQGVRRTGEGRYIARCPAHADKSPSLSLKETNTGDVLLHCFASCSFGDVISSLGMRASDCFASSPTSTPRYRTQHRVHETTSEVEMLCFRYGLTFQYARGLVLWRIKHEGEARH